MKNKLDIELDEVQRLFESHSKDLALKKIDKILKKNNKNYLPYNYRGLISLSLEKVDLALQDFKKALSLNNQFSEGYCNLGNTYLRLNEFEKASESYQKALSLNPSSIEIKINMGMLYFKMGEYDKAVNTYQIILRENSQLEYVHQLIADALIQNYKHTESISHHQEAIKINPFNALNYFLLGRDYLWKGEKKLAIDNIKKSIEINPKHYASYLAISKLESLLLKPMIPTMEAFLKENITLLDKAFIYFSLAKFYEDQKDYENSFNLLLMGNKSMKQHNKFDFKNYEKELKESINFFEENIESTNIHNKYIENKQSPIFIVGMPRSGTSLIEQILSNHPSIFGAGELDTIHNSLLQLIKIKKINQSLIESFIFSLRKKYFDRLRVISDKPFIIDKLPLNFFWIGYIKKIFPNAKILYTERHPISISFSLFKTMFSEGSLDFSYDQEDIVNFYKLHIKFIEYWYTKYPNDILKINYEHFISNSEEISTKIFKFLGLEFDLNYLNLKNNSRSVMTASDLQVRDKIHHENSKNWSPYEIYLEKFKNAY